MLTHCNAKAYAVLAILFDNCSEEQLRSMHIEGYVNCREQGFSIINFSNSKKVSFSEYRNTDNIVVYTGQSHEFSMQGNVPNEDVYELSTFFSYNEYLKAATFIRDFLICES